MTRMVHTVLTDQRDRLEQAHLMICCLANNEIIQINPKTCREQVKGGQCGGNILLCSC